MGIGGLARVLRFGEQHFDFGLADNLDGLASSCALGSEPGSRSITATMFRLNSLAK